MTDQEKADVAAGHCGRIYPKIRRCEKILADLKHQHEFWRKVYEGAQLRMAEVDVIPFGRSGKQHPEKDAREVIKALSDSEKKELLKALTV